MCNLYIYIYTYSYVCMYVCVYIYIYENEHISLSSSLLNGRRPGPAAARPGRLPLNDDIKFLSVISFTFKIILFSLCCCLFNFVRGI